MADQNTYQGATELIAAPCLSYPSGETVTLWEGPPPGRKPRTGREAEYQKAEELMAIGIAVISRRPMDHEVARRCFDEARSLYAEALGADRRLAFAWDRLGYVHQSLGDDDEAEDCYLRSLEAQQRSKQPYTGWNEVTRLNLALIYGNSGRPALNRAVLMGYDPGKEPYLPGATGLLRGGE